MAAAPPRPTTTRPRHTPACSRPTSLTADRVAGKRRRIRGEIIYEPAATDLGQIKRTGTRKGSAASARSPPPLLRPVLRARPGDGGGAAVPVGHRVVQVPGALVVLASSQGRRGQATMPDGEQSSWKATRLRPSRRSVSLGRRRRHQRFGIYLPMVQANLNLLAFFYARPWRYRQLPVSHLGAIGGCPGCHFLQGFYSHCHRGIGPGNQC